MSAAGRPYGISARSLPWRSTKYRWDEWPWPALLPDLVRAAAVAERDDLERDTAVDQVHHERRLGGARSTGQQRRQHGRDSPLH
jgi:hypothetical protein